jgi:hypothetical protein
MTRALDRTRPRRLLPLNDREHGSVSQTKLETPVGKASRKKNRRAGTIDLEPNAKKASTRLAQLIAPHAVDDETRSSYEALVALGAMAWNLSLLPAQDRDNLTREAVWSAVASGIPLTYAWLNELVERKMRLFPSEKRWIQSYEVVLQPDGRFAIVVATVSDG